MINTDYIAAAAQKTAERFMHKGPSGHVYKSDHPLTKSERAQIDAYDRQNPPNLPPAPDRQPAMAGKPVPVPMLPGKGKAKTKGVYTGLPGTDQFRPQSGESAMRQLLTEGRVSGDVQNIKDFHDQEHQDMANTLGPILGPVGNMLGKIGNVIVATPFDQSKVYEKALPNVGAGFLTAGSNSAGDLAILTHPKASIGDRLGAAVNIVSQMIPVEEVAVGTVRNALRKIGKFTPEFENLVTDAIKAGAQDTSGLAPKERMTVTGKAQREAMGIAEPKAPKPGAPDTVTAPTGESVKVPTKATPTQEFWPKEDPEVKGLVWSDSKHWIERVPAAKGRKEYFKVWESGATHSKKVGTVGLEGEQGYRKAREIVDQKSIPTTPNTPKPSETPQTGVKPQETASIKPGETTGLANQVQDKEALSGIISEVEKTKGKSPEDWQQTGKASVDAGKIDPEQLATRIGKGEEELTGEKVGALLEGKRKLQNALNNAKPGEEYNAAKAKLDDYLTNVQQGKGRWSDVGRALQAGTELDTGNFAQVIEHVQKSGAKLSEKQTNAIRDLTEQAAAKDKQIADLQKQIDEQTAAQTAKTQAKRGPRFSREELDTELDDLLKQFAQKAGKASSGIDPELLPIVGKIAVNYMKRGVNTLDEVFNSIKGHFDGLTYEDMIDGINSTAGKARTQSDIQKEIGSLKRQAKSDAGVRAKIADLQNQLDTGDYTLPGKRDKVANKRLDDLRIQREILHREVMGRIKDAQTPIGTKILNETSGAIRGIKLGSDFGVLTRQGLFSWSRPGNAIKGLKNAAKALLSEENLVRIEREMQNARVNGELVQPIRNKSGLQLTHSIINPEELVVGRFLKRIPVVGHLFGKPLERAQLAFLNTIRTEMFDFGVRHGFSDAENKLRAQFTNSVTGRGNVKSVPPIMSAIMTSPRYELSRWETLAAPLKNAAVLGRDLATKNPKLNRAALANIQDMAVTTASVYGLFKAAELSGYSVNWDPKSGDFLKMRKGNEVWDVSAGLAPRLRDLLRTYVAWDDPKYDHDIMSVVKGTVGRTISPSVRMPLTALSASKQKAAGKTIGTSPSKSVIDPFTGYPLDPQDDGFNAFLPLILQSIKQAAEEGGTGAAIGAAAKEFVGSGVNRYPAKKGG